MARELTQTISMWPWRSGLATAGQQTSVPETSLWQAKNVTAGLDGLLKKRPGLEQWGQTLYQPAGSAQQFYEDFLEESLPGWIESDTGGLTSLSFTSGVLRANTLAGTSTDVLVQSYAPVSPILSDASLRVTLQCANLPSYNGTDTTPQTFNFRVVGQFNVWQFAIYEEGLHYQQASDDTFALIDGTAELGEGKWTTLEIRIDNSDNTTVYVDGTLVDTVATSLLKLTSSTQASSQLDLEFRSDDTVQYNVSVTDLMYNNTVSDPFEVVEVENVGNFNSIQGSGLQRTLLAAAGDYVYHDAGCLGVWRPLYARKYDSTYFTTFRREALIIDTNRRSRSKLLLWSGKVTEALEELGEAPNVAFATEHQTRIWAAGDRDNPLRVYYSGDREPDVWFAPAQNNISDRFDTQVKAGYIEVPSRDGDEVTAVFGDFYGQLLVWTRQGVFRVEGSGPTSYAVTSISQDVGCESEYAIAQVGNDVWFVSREGIHSVAATEKFGDVQRGYVSGTIQNLWGGDESTAELINRDYLSQARMAYFPVLSLVMVALPLGSNTTAQDVFVFNTTTSEWYGPWSIDTRGLKRGEIQSPVYETVLTGNGSGQVLYTNTNRFADAGEEYTMVLESALLNGRDLDPRLVGTMKTWKRMRIYLLPRGDWDFKVFWRTDNSAYQEETTDENQNKSQNLYKGYGLTTEFRLNEDPDGRLAIPESLGYVEIRPGRRGYSFSFKIEQDGAGETIAIQGVEVDFTYAAHEVE